MSADNLLIAVIVLLILALVCLAVLLFRPRPPVTDSAALEAVDRSGREMREEIGRVRRDLGEVGSAQRTELSGSLNNFSQTLATQMSGIATVQDGKIDGFAAQLAKLTEANEARLTEIRNTLETKLRELQGENAAKLEEMRKTVDERLHATLEHRLGESFKLVSDRLEQVHRGLGEMQTLAAGVGDLKRVLTNVKTRGTWGEVQLEALLEQMLVREQFEKNVATRPGSSERVEFAIRMPGRVDGAQVWLPLDSKFPAEVYDRLIAAQDRADAAAVEESARALEMRIRLEAKTIRDKYIEPPYTTDFALLFLPTEGLYAEVLRRPGLADTLQRDFRVVIAGPTTLAAILNSLQMGFRTLAIEQRSGEIQLLLGAVKTEFGRFGEVLANTKKQLETVTNSIGKAEVRTRAIERKLRDVEALPTSDAQVVLGKASDPGDEEEG
ncbi:MAG: DNA recombination protein RmuC [Proteobacteria bacterium]|nr:DNA recombination protein RmuC [Pseudomonadota bacterium]